MGSRQQAEKSEREGSGESSSPVLRVMFVGCDETKVVGTVLIGKAGRGRDIVGSGRQVRKKERDLNAPS